MLSIFCRCKQRLRPTSHHEDQKKSMQTLISNLDSVRNFIPGMKSPTINLTILDMVMMLL